MPILFALLLKEVKRNWVKRTVQTFSYLPHFISVVVVVGMMKIFLSPTDGIVNMAIQALGGTPVNFFSEAKLFRWLYVFSNIWQNFGWDSIIYFAAISGVDVYKRQLPPCEGGKREGAPHAFRILSSERGSGGEDQPGDGKRPPGDLRGHHQLPHRGERQR